MSNDCSQAFFEQRLELLLEQCEEELYAKYKFLSFKNSRHRVWVDYLARKKAAEILALEN